MQRASLFALLVVVSRLAVADASYHIGNSLTWDMYSGGLIAIANGFGVSLTPGYHIRSSQSLVYIVNHPDDATLVSPASWPAGLQAQRWDFVTFQPYPDANSPSTMRSDFAAARTFMARVPPGGATNPTFFIYEAWPSQPEFQSDYSAYWNRTVPDDLDQRTTFARQYFDALHQRLAAADRTATVREIPVGDVFARIDQRIRAGQFAGARDIKDFYRDPIHMGIAGKYIAAMTTFATLYGRKPAGASYAALAQLPLEGAVVLDAPMAAELERIVWEVLTSDGARTGIYPLTLDRALLAFASTRVGSTSASQSVVLTNITDGPLAIDAVTASGPFTAGSSCGEIVAANASCTVEVAFVPPVDGPSQGTLTVLATGGSYEVALSGTGAWPPLDLTIAASPTVIDVGQATSITWTSSGTGCNASGGSISDGWAGAKPPNGTVAIVESNAYTDLLFTLTCSSSSSGLAKSSSVRVTWNAPVPQPADKGGGGLDCVSLLVLLSTLVLAVRLPADASCVAGKPGAGRPR